MSTEFERELSELLHSVTPEPPDHLAPPRVTTLPEADVADATVIDLTTGPADMPGRRHRWQILAAAASVTALAAGVVGLTQIDYGRHPTAHPPVGTAISTPTTSNAATAPICRNDQIVISQGPTGFVTHSGTGSIEANYRNQSATPCTLSLPTATIGMDVTGGTPFPAAGGTLQIPRHGQLVMTAHVRVIGRCRTVQHGLRINFIDGPYTYSFWLRVAGCTLTPLRLTQHVVR